MTAEHGEAQKHKSGRPRFRDGHEIEVVHEEVVVKAICQAAQLDLHQVRERCGERDRFEIRSTARAICEAIESKLDRSFGPIDTCADDLDARGPDDQCHLFGCIEGAERKGEPRSFDDDGVSGEQAARSIGRVGAGIIGAIAGEEAAAGQGIGEGEPIGRELHSEQRQAGVAANGFEVDDDRSRGE